LGKSGRVCVFASDLREVWNLKVKDAAVRSGYNISTGGDEPYVWVFAPTHKVVPASWDEVLKNLPAWLQPFE